MAHIQPLPREQIPELEEVFAHYEGTRGFVPNSLRIMGHRPNIARAVGQLNQAVLYEGTLDTGLKMLATTMASYAAGCRYCQAHQVTRAEHYAVPPEKIEAVWDFETSDLFTEAERAALRLARDAVQVPNAVTEQHFTDLKQHFDDGQIVELVASVALFGYLNRWNDTMATPLEDLPLKTTNQHWGARGWTPGKHGSSP